MLWQTVALGTGILSSHEEKNGATVHLLKVSTVSTSRRRTPAVWLFTFRRHHSKCLGLAGLPLWRPDAFSAHLHIKTWLTLDQELAGFKNSEENQIKFYSCAIFFSYIFTVLLLSLLSSSSLVTLHSWIQTCESRDEWQRQSVFLYRLQIVKLLKCHVPLCPQTIWKWLKTRMQKSNGFIALCKEGQVLGRYDKRYIRPSTIHHCHEANQICSSSTTTDYACRP